MKTFNFAKNIHSLKYKMQDFYSQNKLKIIVCFAFCFIGILTGIFTAFKIHSINDKDLFEAFNLTYQLKDLENFSNNFFSRFLSCELVLFLFLIFSLYAFLFPFGWCLLAYRAFLVSINAIMIILFFSFNGLIKSILIILPCQIATLIVFAIFYCFMCKQFKTNSYLKCKKFNGIMFPILITSLLLTIINLFETFLLFIFRSNVILVI